MKVLRVEYVIIKKQIDKLNSRNKCKFNIGDMRLDQVQALQRIRENRVAEVDLTSVVGRTVATFKYPSQIEVLQRAMAATEEESINIPSNSRKRSAKSQRTQPCSSLKMTSADDEKDCRRAKKEVKKCSLNSTASTSQVKNTRLSEASTPESKDDNKLETSECNSKHSAPDNNLDLKVCLSNEKGIKMKIKIEPKDDSKEKTSKDYFENYYKMIDKQAEVNATARLDQLNLSPGNHKIKEIYMKFFIEERRAIMSTLKKSSKLLKC